MITVTRDGEVHGANPFNITGRLYVRVSGVRRPVSHLVLEAFVGPCPDGMEALHANDIGTDNRLENLRWGTHSENMFDAVRNGNHGQARKTHCPQGHEYTLENTQYGSNKRGKYRRCRTCRVTENANRSKA